MVSHQVEWALATEARRRLAQEGADATEIQALLGHESLTPRRATSTPARATTTEAGSVGLNPAPGQTSPRRHGKIPADLLGALADWQVQFDTDIHYETGWIGEDLSAGWAQRGEEVAAALRQAFPPTIPSTSISGLFTTKAPAMAACGWYHPVGW